MHTEESFKKLSAWIESQDYRGYDPYDTLNSWVPFHWLGKWGPVLAIQFQKRNPLNIRPLLGIKKGVNPKAFGLFLQAYSQLYLKTGEMAYREKADFFYGWLANNFSKGYEGTGWGYNFPWAGPGKYLEPYVPTAVVTGFVSRGLYDYYQATGNPGASDLLAGAARFILNNLPVHEDEHGVCISYTPLKQDYCYNASLLGAEVLAKYGALSGNGEYQKLAEKAVDWVIRQQKPDGRWNYSIDLATGIERAQVDFHQGYVVESIYEIGKALKADRPAWDSALTSGLGFYRREQFLESGQSLWRLPKVWPVDIHNQSQGIITFSRMHRYGEGYLDFARRIAAWTIREMQSPEGYFYYRNYRYHKHRIPYMRWSQAWMFLALSQLIPTESHEKD